MANIYLIGNAHLDPVWLWQWQEGFMEIKSTFRSALDRMKEYEEFKFTSACSAYYMWIEKSDPKMFEEIKERVAEGRWCITGGMFVQPDCNMPCGEAFARHILISQKYFKEKFGIIAETGYNVDSFGHNGNLPQILKNGRMKNYVFLRPMPNEKYIESMLFDWKSMDGSCVRAYRIPLYYNITTETFSAFEEIKSMAKDVNAMAFYGVGNHGGGATKELLNKMKEQLSDEFIYSTPDEYFAAVENENVPTVCEDLQFHAKGCYSAHGKIKATNCKAENAAFTAEVFSVMSEKLVGSQYPKAEYERAWKNILFNQFHDILCGCSIKEAYDDAENVYGEALSITGREQNFALSQISWQIDTVGGECPEVYKPSNAAVPSWRSKENIGTPVVIFNPLPFAVNEVVAVHDLPDYVTDNYGRVVPSQCVRDSKTIYDQKYKTIFMATVPPMGYSVYRMYFNFEQEAPKSMVTACDTYLENEVLKVVFDERSGEICEIYDKRINKSVVRSGAETVLVEDNGDTWAHNISEFKKVVARAEKENLQVTENGPVRASIRITQRVGDSRIIRDYSLVCGSDEINVQTKIDFHEKHKMLKFQIPVNARNPEAYCEIPFGFTKRSTDGSEHVSGRWIALSDKEMGIGIVTDSKYSFDACDNTLSLSVLRGCLYAEHEWEGKNGRDEFCEYMEQGEHDFEYRIFPYTTTSNATNRGQRLNNPPTAIVETFHGGALKTSFSGIKISANNIIVTAVKKHESLNAVVLRCYEADNKATFVKFDLFGTKFEASFGNNEIKTFVIDNGRVYETDFLEE